MPTPAVWKNALLDSLGFVVAVWSIPAAILLIGTPIMIVVVLAITLMRWMLPS